ncbi:MAG: hypothetical protein U5L04_00870 [Trueperaceae bacterium]|nr:hypothetical protein [Trueperaceae bacterium]
MNIAAHRHQRSQLYRLLAAVHAGPLGYSLMETVRSAATGLLGLTELPGMLPEPPAQSYGESYGFCSGNPDLGCAATAPSDCLTGKFLYLAASARKGATKRREREADYIEHELLPCLETRIDEVTTDAHRQLLVISRAIVRADAACIRRYRDEADYAAQAG